MRCNGRDAPIPDLPALALEGAGSTHSRHPARRMKLRPLHRRAFSRTDICVFDSRKHRILNLPRRRHATMQPAAIILTPIIAFIRSPECAVSLQS